MINLIDVVWENTYEGALHSIALKIKAVETRIKTLSKV